MIDGGQLQSLLLDLESDRVERKSSIADRDRICEAICAFANDLADHRQPGVLFIGADDDGNCANLQITDQLLQTLADMRSAGNILPLPEMTVHKRTIGGCELAVVEVNPSISPPVRFRGRVWIRIGPRRAVASREEERRLSEKRLTLDLPFDHQPVSGTSIDDLDLNLFERTYLPSALPTDVLSENERSIEQQLRALHFVAADGTPNVAAILTLGVDPRSWIPGAYAQFARFDGSDLTDPIRHQEEIDGALIELLTEVDRVLSSQISMHTVVDSSGPEIREPDYPLAALTQIVRNAVLHRNYEATNALVRIYWFEDRVEVHSPGSPFGQVSVENIGRPAITDYRNPLLAEVMKTLGYVQRFGMGFPLAQKELNRNGNPPLEIQAQPTAVLVTLRRKF